MMRQIRWGSIISMLLLLTLGACRGDVSNTAADDLYGDLGDLDPSSTLVVFWHGLTGDKEARLLELIDDFNVDNEWGITVVGEYQGDLETLHGRIETGIPGGKLPHLLLTSPNLVATYAAQEAAVELSPYVQNGRWGFSQAEREDFFSGALAADRLPQFQDGQYSLPLCRSLQVLYYNVDWLKELDYEDPPQNWEALREMACAASQPADGLYGFEFGMNSLLFTSLLASQDLALFDAEEAVYTFGGPQGRAAVQYLQDLIVDGCAQWETETGPIIDFGAGQVLFAVDSTAELATYRRVVAEEANFEWSVAPLPHTTEGPVVGVRGPSLALLPRTPREQLAAWLFVKWLAEPDQQARWATTATCYPVRRSALSEMDEYLDQYPQRRLAAQLLEERWISEPNVTDYPACRAAIGRTLYAVTAGESVDQWLNDARQLCNQTLAE